MSSLRLKTDVKEAGAALQKIRLAAHQQFATEKSVASEPVPEDHAEYDGTNPDSINSRGRFFHEPNDELALFGVDDPSVPASRSILRKRVVELEKICLDLGYGEKLVGTCFGTVPGFGLDAHVHKISGRNSYVIIIPERLFYFTNLISKLVILLQPISSSPEGPVFLPNAAVAQFQLMKHPYIVWRLRDLLEAFFFMGDPMMALPYRHAIPYQDRFSYLLAGPAARR